MNSFATRTKFVFFVPVAACVLLAADVPRDPSPQPDERQLPDAMHSAMTDLPRITVGRENADLIGTDNRALQAAVDYIAALGGGTVEIGPGEYLMRDSLHLRSQVTVCGRAGETRLRKADAAVSALALDGDFGEEQISGRGPPCEQRGQIAARWTERQSHDSLTRQHSFAHREVP